MMFALYNDVHGVAKPRLLARKSRPFDHSIRKGLPRTVEARAQPLAMSAIFKSKGLADAPSYSELSEPYSDPLSDIPAPEYGFSPKAALLGGLLLCSLADEPSSSSRSSVSSST